MSKTDLQQRIDRLQQLQSNGVKLLVIIRGLPGSGKSTLARLEQSFFLLIFHILVSRQFFCEN